MKNRTHHIPMTVQNRRTTGFTLVEILIVVVILGILAAIVIPQFTSASESARGNSLISQLQTVRSQLELYQVQHNGSYPTLLQLWGNMTAKTLADGTVDPAGDFGPYLQQDPLNPFTDSAGVAADNTADWQYDEATGAIIAVVDATQAAAAGLTLNVDYVAAP
jgi:general secretion pathway protein G